jgi:DNA polymerase III subunit gamma/tau
VSTAPSLYRRHRPRSFADVVGQEHVVRTLRNAVQQDKLHHAYLFVGSRGTGKTSMAKILAACLNCSGTPESPRTGPTVEPCGVCPSCRSIASATSLDVIEMDAASNNSVDDIRGLRDAVAFAPVSGRFKVYILDEAHMLSTAAWNAFLKTLEEPPPSTIFVLATTEANKVLPTVVDRCHRFDFTRPTVEQLAAVVQRVADAESIAIPKDAVALLARHATGSFRDALGTLEQLVTYSGPQIVVEDVLAVLGVADADLLFGALDAVAAHDARAALLAVGRLVDTGRDVARFVTDLEAHARELMVVQTLGEVPPELAVTPDRDARLTEQASRLTGGDVVRVLDGLAAAQRATKDGADARTQLELALVKAATPEVDASTRALLGRLERLEHALAGAPRAVPPVTVPAPVAPVAPPPGMPPQPTMAGEHAGPPSAAPPSAAPQAAAPQAAAPPPPAAAPPEPPREPARQPEPEPDPEPVQAPVAVAERPAPGALDLPALLEVWPAVLDAVREQHTLLAACLAEARPLSSDGREVVLAFDQSGAFHRRQCEDGDSKAILAEAVRTLTGAQPRIVFETRDLAELGPDPSLAAPAAPGAPAGDEDWVDRFKAEFDAIEIVPEDDPDPSPEP